MPITVNWTKKRWSETSRSVSLGLDLCSAINNCVAGNFFFLLIWIRRNWVARIGCKLLLMSYFKMILVNRNDEKKTYTQSIDIEIEIEIKICMTWAVICMCVSVSICSLAKPDIIIRLLQKLNTFEHKICNCHCDYNFTRCEDQSHYIASR